MVGALAGGLQAVRACARAACADLGQSCPAADSVRGPGPVPVRPHMTLSLLFFLDTRPIFRRPQMDEWRVVLRPSTSPVLSSAIVDNSLVSRHDVHAQDPWNASQIASTNGRQIVKRTTRAISTLRSSSSTSSHDGSTSSGDEGDSESDEDSTTTTTTASLCPLCLQPLPRPRPRSVTPPSITPLPPDTNYFNRLSLSLSAYSSRNASRDGSPEGSRRTTPVLSTFPSIDSETRFRTPLAHAGSSHTAYPNLTTQAPTQQDSNPILPTQLNEGYYSTFFRVLKKLGRGGSGTVELVEHVLDGETLGVYAVKKSRS